MRGNRLHRAGSLRSCIGLALLVVVAAACAVAQNPGPPGVLVAGTEVLSQTGTQLFLPAGFGPRQFGWILQFEQASARDGLFSLNLDSATDGDRWRSGNNLAAWRNAPLLGQQADFLAGTLNLPSDLLSQHFANLFSPNLILSGGEVALRDKRGWRLLAFGGRNLISQGPYIPFFTSAPDFIWGVSLRPPAWHRWQFEARFLHTTANTTLAPVLDGGLNPIPAASHEIFLNANWRLDRGAEWLNEVAVSHAANAPADAGRSVSFASGPILARPHYDLQAYVMRQSPDYLPVSNMVVGDREGAYAAGDFRIGRRWSLSSTGADFRDNVTNDPALPTLDVLSTSGALTFAPSAGYTLTANASQTDLSSLSGAAAAARLTTVEAQATRRYGENQTQFRWQDWLTRSRGLGAASAIQTEEIDQQRSFGRSFLSAAFGLQQGNSAGASQALSMHMNLAASLSLGRRLTFFASGLIGRDLRDQSALSLTTLRTWVAEAQIHLPGQSELSAQFVRNSVVSQLNAQRLLLAGLDAGPVFLLPGNSQQVVFIRLTKRFRWGARVPLWTNGGEGLASRLIPSYGSVEGVVFDDRAHSGERAAGDEGIPGVVLRLDGAVATTDARGRFQFNGVRTGRYTLELDVDHLPVRYTAPSQTEIPVEVRASGTPAIVIPLQLVGTVRGRLQADGQAASDPAPDLAGVALRLAPGNELAFTDARGAFHFDNVAPGAYRIEVLMDSLPPQTSIVGATTALVSVSSGAAIAGLDFRLRVATPPTLVETIVAPAEHLSLAAPQVADRAKARSATQQAVPAAAPRHRRQPRAGSRRRRAMRHQKAVRRGKREQARRRSRTAAARHR